MLFTAAVRVAVIEALSLSAVSDFLFRVWIAFSISVRRPSIRLTPSESVGCLCAEGIVGGTFPIAWRAVTLFCPSAAGSSFIRRLLYAGQWSGDERAERMSSVRIWPVVFWRHALQRAHCLPPAIPSRTRRPRASHLGHLRISLTGSNRDLSGDAGVRDRRPARRALGGWVGGNKDEVGTDTSLEFFFRVAVTGLVIGTGMAR